MRTLERETSVETSLKIAEDTIKYFGLEVVEKIFGKTSHPQTYQCQLLDHRKQVSFFGLGKGVGLQSKASAYYEALEHFVIHDYCQKIGGDLENYHLIHGIHSSLTDNPVPCAAFKNLRTGEEHLYPLYLIDPRYSKRKPSIDKNEYSGIAWEASDSGTASGTSIAEASVHAINELVERHSYSQFLIDAFFGEPEVHNGEKLFLVDKNTLPEHLRNIVQSIERDYDDEIMIFEMPNELGIPSYFVCMTRQTFPLQPRGCGTSLFRDYAIERAILEMLQPLQVWNDHMLENQKQIIDNFSRFPHLKRCAVADVLSIKERCEVRGDRQIAEHSDIPPTVVAQHATLEGKILAANFDAYVLEMAKLETGYTCVRYLIPDFENFYLVQAGKLILPKRKTLSPQKALGFTQMNKTGGIG